MRWSLALSLSFFLGLALGSWRVREVFSSPSSAYQSDLSELCLTQSQQSELSGEMTTDLDGSPISQPVIKVQINQVPTNPQPTQNDQGGADVESESAQIIEAEEPDIPEQTQTLENQETDPEGPRRKRR